MTASESDSNWDVVVIGAGPAGSLAARELARLGRRVLLVDQAHFPRRKVCGCCLNDRALNTLNRVGLGALAIDLNAIPLTKMWLGAGGRSAEVRVRGVSLSRDALDVALIQAAMDCGVSFRPGVRATLGDVTPEWRRVNLGYEYLDTKVVIAADGLNGRVCATADGFVVDVKANSRIGAGTVLAEAPAAYRPGVIAMATGKAGYVGLVQLEDGRWDVAAAFDAASIRNAGGLGHTAVQVLADAGFPPIPGLAESAWKGTPPLTRRPVKVAGERWFAIGDAAGYVEPFTGEGMAWAMASAEAVAPIANRAIANWHSHLRREWVRRHAIVVGSRQGVCRAMAFALQYPGLCRAAVTILARLPRLANPFVASINRSIASAVSVPRSSPL